MRRNARPAWPWSAFIFGGLGAATLVRAFYRPKRIVLDGAFVSKCAGMEGCDAALTLQTFSGTELVYSAASGNVVSVGPRASSVSIMPDNEAVVLDYSAGDPVSQSLTVFDTVQPGVHVETGQPIGRATQLRFGVYQLERTAAGAAKLGKAYEPASWLAVRGLAPTSAAQPGHEGLWCERGRELNVPQHVAQCGMTLPEPGAWSLLPVKMSLT